MFQPAMRLEVHIHHHRDGDEAILLALESIMHTLDEVLAEVTKETDEAASITALINGLRQQIADALAGQTIPPPLQAKVDAIFAAAQANNAALVQALNDPGQAPAPPAPPPAPAPSAGPPNPPVAEPSTDAGQPQTT